MRINTPLDVSSLNASIITSSGDITTTGGVHCAGVISSEGISAPSLNVENRIDGDRIVGDIIEASTKFQGDLVGNVTGNLNGVATYARNAIINDDDTYTGLYRDSNGILQIKTGEIIPVRIPLYEGQPTRMATLYQELQIGDIIEVHLSIGFDERGSRNSNIIKTYKIKSMEDEHAFAYITFPEDDFVCDIGEYSITIQRYSPACFEKNTFTTTRSQSYTKSV